MNKKGSRLVLWFLIFLPYATFIFQFKRNFLYEHSIEIPKVLTLISLGWKELIVAIFILNLIYKWIKNRRLDFEMLLMDKYLLILLAVSVGYSLIINQNFKELLFGLRYDFSVLAYYLIGRFAILNRDQFMNLLKTLIMAWSPIMVFAILQSLVLPISFMERFGYSWGMGAGGNPLPPYHLVGGNLIRAFSTFPGPNSLALFAGLSLLIIWFMRKQVFTKKQALLFGSLYLAAFILTYSRGHIIALICASLMIIFFKRLKNKTAPLITLAILGVLLLSIGLPYVSYSLPKSENNYISKFFLHDNSTQVHSDVRTLAFEKIKNTPLGSGIGTAGLATTNTGGKVFNPESWYLTLGVELGWFGFLVAAVFISLVLKLLSGIYNNMQDEVDQNNIHLLLAMFLMVVFGATFLPCWFESGSILTWILIGTLASDFAYTFPKSRL